MRGPSKQLGRQANPKRMPALTQAGDALEGIASHYSLDVRSDVHQLLRSSNRLVDLAAAFPGAIYALATRRGAPARRRDALALIEDGAPLKSVAKALDLPYWLRRLPAAAFEGPLGTLPTSEVFARRIATRLPRRAADSAFWLASVTFGAAACHDDFALWLAEQPLYSEPGEPRRLFAVLAAYAWFSGAVMTRAHNLIVVPWRPEVALDTALCAAKTWLNRMRLVLQLEAGIITDSWLKPGSVAGLNFEPLLDQEAILEEAHAMQNCADQYADRLARDRCRLFSVRRNGSRVATLEIGPHPRETGVLAITQLKSRHNMPADIEVWQAAHAWLATQNGLKRLPPMMRPDRPLNDRIWQQLMLPYRNRKSLVTSLPEHATHATFGMLDAELADLARRGCVSSWLFT